MYKLLLRQVVAGLRDRVTWSQTAGNFFTRTWAYSIAAYSVLRLELELFIQPHHPNSQNHPSLQITRPTNKCHPTKSVKTGQHMTTHMTQFPISFPWFPHSRNPLSLSISVFCLNVSEIPRLLPFWFFSRREIEVGDFFPWCVRATLTSQRTILPFLHFGT